MKKIGVIIFVISLFVFSAFQPVEAKKNYYRTFEVISITENSLTLQDSDGNVIEVDKDPGDHKIGYKVRYDSVRKRLRAYSWQDYEVSAISGDSITLQHETGDMLSVQGNYTGKYDIGDQVRYNSVDNKLQPDKSSGQWKQYTVVEASSNNIIIQSNDDQKIFLQMDNNLYPERRGVYIGRYKVGDLVRYNPSTNKLKMGVLKTYDWQDYMIKEVTEDQLILINNSMKELILENTYGTQYNAGDPVKYDRLNNLLKKAR